ncbi:unnamed protein product [Pleuronectes platessa]|uniref:Uncharacterized protein n=1 Tax=Pleuronectes platessa TaxID=8262 RepID=A0A9N7TQV3_PLEPL|nr:unnamed protein product [Pleuronectes platessa]
MPGGGGQGGVDWHVRPLQRSTSSDSSCTRPHVYMWALVFPWVAPPPPPHLSSSHYHIGQDLLRVPRQRGENGERKESAIDIHASDGHPPPPLRKERGLISSSSASWDGDRVTGRATGQGSLSQIKDDHHSCNPLPAKLTAPSSMENESRLHYNRAGQIPLALSEIERGEQRAGGSSAWPYQRERVRSTTNVTNPLDLKELCVAGVETRFVFSLSHIQVGALPSLNCDM